MLPTIQRRAAEQETKSPAHALLTRTHPPGRARGDPRLSTSARLPRRRTRARSSRAQQPDFRHALQDVGFDFVINHGVPA